MKYFTCLFFFGLFATAAAQSKLPTNYVDSTGNLYWRKSVPVYLFVSDDPEGGDKHRLESKLTAQYADPFYLDTEGINYIRSRNAVDPDTRKSIPDTEVMFEIYADGIPPVTNISYEKVNRHATATTTYYKSGLQVALSARDQLSGLQKISYNVNGGDFQLYSNPLSFEQPGTYTISYYSEDKVGNLEETRNVSFVIDDTPPYSDLTINGITSEGVISIGSKMYILALDTIADISKVLYKFDDGEYMTYKGGDIDFKKLEEGRHEIHYYATDRVNNVEKVKSKEFFFDKSAPLMVADVLGDRFIVEDQVYFSGRTKLKLTAVDNKVGVKEIMYSVDSDAFKKYDQPFYLPSISGVHLIRYYSVDNLDNSTADDMKGNYLGQGGFEEFKHNVNKVYVDLTGPVISHQVLDYSFTRSDTVFIGPFSRIKFTGKDTESGLKGITYSLNDKIEEIDYLEPIKVADEGFNVLNYYGYDNVNNRNLNRFAFYLDATKPDIYIQFNTGSTGNKDDLSVYPATAGVFLSASDKTSGIRALFYKLDDQPERPYAGLITGLKKGKHKLQVRAMDFLNNESIKEVQFQIRD